MREKEKEETPRFSERLEKRGNNEDNIVSGLADQLLYNITAAHQRRQAEQVINNIPPPAR